MKGVLKPREERIANDRYFTPEPLAEEICRRLARVLPEQEAIWDPCAGGGAFIEAAYQAWAPTPRLVQFAGTDLPEHDFLRDRPKRSGRDGWSLIVSNPPYLLAEPFVHNALALVREGGHVAFLLRLSFLCGQRRYGTLWAHGAFRYLIPITPRPSFTPDGKTDASEYAVFVWQRGYSGTAEILPHLRWNR